MRVYISGQITGIDIAVAKIKFEAMEEFLRNIGFEPINPMKNGLSSDEKWIKHMCRDIELLDSCDAILMLDDWTCSLGACIEYDFSIRTGKKIYFQNEIVKHQPSIAKVKEAIHSVMGLTLNDYATPSRKRDLFFARMIFVHHCKQNIPMTKIAEIINRAHSSVTYLVKKYKDEYRYNPSFRSIAKSVEEKIKTIAA